jgi:hypothetical protein|uniref:Uncharacterized protein n=1 Tax=viral metagenome TaxID=1070528 RepID=A0A6C0IV00_9ZZZZ
MQFHKYFSKNELELVYLLFRHYTHSLPPRDVISHVLELRVKPVIMYEYGRKREYTEKDGLRHGLEQWWYKDGRLYKTRSL